MRLGLVELLAQRLRLQREREHRFRFRQIGFEFGLGLGGFGGAGLEVVVFVAQHFRAGERGGELGVGVGPGL